MFIERGFRRLYFHSTTSMPYVLCSFTCNNSTLNLFFIILSHFLEPWQLPCCQGDQNVTPFTFVDSCTLCNWLLFSAHLRPWFRFKGSDVLPLITRVFETTEVKISLGTLEATIKSTAEALDMSLHILGHNEGTCFACGTNLWIRKEQDGNHCHTWKITVLR